MSLNLYNLGKILIVKIEHIARVRNSLTTVPEYFWVRDFIIYMILKN